MRYYSLCGMKWHILVYEWEEVGNHCSHSHPRPMFIGEYRHTLDAKNRVSLPAKFRKGLGSEVILTRGLDKCLFVYPKAAWKKEAQRFSQYSAGTASGRAFARLMLAGAIEADVDSAGRILVPDYLKAYGNLSGKCVFAGVSDRVELWEEGAWDTYTKTIERDADQFAETLGERAMG